MSRLTDNDRNWGPFTLGPWSNQFSASLSSGDYDDRGTRFTLVGFGWALRTRMPPIMPLGRRYGISLNNMGKSYDFFQIHYGVQSHDSKRDCTWSKHLPWTQWLHVRHTIYMPDGTAFYSERRDSDWRTFFAMKEKCPKTYFGFEDYDGELIIATCTLEEREWHKGTGWFRWLSWFHRPKIYRTLDLEFSAEVGSEKGSWKGGTIGHSIELFDNESTEGAFRRYCANGHNGRGRKKTNLRFIGPCEAPPPKVYVSDPGDQPAVDSK